MLRVGLTGGIACGKSHVLRRLRALGLPALDLDQVSREVVAPGQPALADIAEAFGPTVLSPSGALDRAALGRVVFGDASARARLNAIVHPRLRGAEAAWAAERAAAGDAVAVTDAALIVESGAHLRFHRVVVVHCDPDEQLARLRARDGLDEASARARVDAQMPLAEKRAFAHFTVDTSGTVDETDARAASLAGELRALADRRFAPGPPLAALAAIAAAGPAGGPRGLSPLALLEAAAEAGGLEMEALAARLEPPCARWLEAARAAPPGAPAAALSAALVAWQLARGGADGDYLASAAASLARLTHEDARERAAACLYALVVQAVAAGDAREPAGIAAALGPLAMRWGGGAPAEWIASAWADDRSAADGSVEAGLASALEAARRGAAGERWPAEERFTAVLRRVAAA